MISAKDLKDLFGENTPERVILKARKIAAKGRSDQAIAILKDGVGRLGEDPELRTEMATLCLASGRVKEAAEALRALLKASAAHTARVEEYIGWARTHHAGIEPLYEALAEGHIARRNITAAVDCLEHLDKKALETSLAARLTNLNRFLEKEGASVPRSAVATLYLAAAGYEALGDWQKAVDSYKKILSALPSEITLVDDRLKALVGRNYRLTPLRLLYAEILEGIDRKDDALEQYLTTLEVDPRAAADVAAALDRFLERAPDDPGLQWAKVKVYLAAGSLPEALDQCGRLIDAGLLLPEIEKLIDELSASGKESVDTQLLLARVSIAQGKASRAVTAVAAALGNDAGQRGIEALERIVEVFPGEARPYQILAEHHLKAGRIDRAIEIFKALRVVDPGSAPSIAARLQSVIVADPGNTAAQELLEEVAIEAGDAAGAVPFLRRRLRQGKDEARRVLDTLRTMLIASPGEKGLKLAAAEASVALEDPEGGWAFLKDMLSAQSQPDQDTLHMMVLCAGASEASYAAAEAFLASPGLPWAGKAEVSFALGEAAARVGRFRDAIALIRKAAAACPDAAEVCKEAIRSFGRSTRVEGGENRAVLAEALLEAGDQPAALEVLRGTKSMPSDVAARLIARLNAALRADPRNLSLSGALAEVYLLGGHTERAMQLARAGLAGRKDPESGPLMMIYGDALVAAGKSAEATKAYASAPRREPSLAAESIERLRRIIQLDMGLETAHFALGRLLIHGEQINEGVNELMTAWSIRSDLAPQVIADLDRCARQYPGDPAVEFARAQLLLGTGDPVAAAECLGTQVGRDRELADEILTRLEGIIARNPDCARAHFQLARACLVKGWVTRACECMLKAHELDQGLAEAVRAALGEVILAFPDVAEVQLARGVMYERHARPLPAAEAYRVAARMGGAAGRDALARLRVLGASCGEGEVRGRIQLILAQAARHLGEFAEAIESAGEAMNAAGGLAADVCAELNQLALARPGDAMVRMERARCHLALQSLESAARDLSEALRLDPSTAGKVTGLARRILERRPDLKEAVMVLAEALELSDDPAQAARVLDDALETSEGRDDLDLVLARRRVASASGDAEGAARLLERAFRTAPDKDALLAALHQEALRQPPSEADRTGDEQEILSLLLTGNLPAAGERAQRMQASSLKAWALQLCGRQAEAAACLRSMLETPGAAAGYAALHDRIVCRELLGEAEALMALTPVRFDEFKPTLDADRAAGARGAAAGGSQ